MSENSGNSFDPKQFVEAAPHSPNQGAVEPAQPVQPVQQVQAGVQPPEREPKKGKGKVIAIVSFLGVVIVGLCVVIGLIVSGAFSEETKKSRKTSKTAKKTTTEESGDPTDDPTEDPTDDPTSDTTEDPAVDPTSDTSDTSGTSAATSGTTDPNLQPEMVSSIDQVSPKLLDTLISVSKERFETDPDTQLPDKVTLLNFNYLGMAITDEFWEGDDGDDFYTYNLWLLFQVQVTDSTGGQAQERQFFWYAYFREVYTDGTYDSSVDIAYKPVMCFDNWSISGLQSVARFLKEAGTVVETNVDESLILPLDGKPYSPEEDVRVTKESELTSGQFKKMQEVAEECMNDFDRPSNTTVRIDKMTLLGTYFGTDNYESTIVALVYEMSLVYQGNTYVYYWYAGFYGTYTGGECLTAYMLRPTMTIDYGDFTAKGFLMVDDVISDLESWGYSNNVENNVDTSLSTVGFVFPNSDKEEISEDRIKALSDEGLRRAINEIWARHGYIFRNQDILDYYRQFEWYEEKIPADEWDKNGQDYYLNDIEKKNIKKMTDERDRRA
ncbi:MAG: YARHG domain-containing protein [Clostridiales bacterium]|nr:YARHG domain-containing protein [Clostridiales bacterium]